MESYGLMGRVSAWDKEVLEMDSGNDCATMSVYLIVILIVGSVFLGLSKIIKNLWLIPFLTLFILNALFVIIFVLGLQHKENVKNNPQKMPLPLQLLFFYPSLLVISHLLTSLLHSSAINTFYFLDSEQNSSLDLGLLSTIAKTLA